MLGQSNSISPARRRGTRAISPQLNKKLLAYAAVAGAGICAGAEPANAEIVYTPVEMKVDGKFFIDLNHDGIPDFVVSSSYFSLNGFLSVKPLVKGNRIAATRAACFANPMNAAALPARKTIGPGIPFRASANCMAFLDDSYSNGPWLFKKGEYLGVVFVIEGQEHYGWVRLSMRYWLFDEVAGVLSFAYETEPGKPIVTGDTGSLGVLALGALGRNQVGRISDWK